MSNRRIKTTFLRATLPLSVALLLSACVTPSEVAPVIEPPISEIDVIIADAAKRAVNANLAVSEVEVAIAAPTRAGPGQSLPPGVTLPPEIMQLVDLDWQGPVEPMLQALADRAGYTFRVVGRRPSVPLTVAMSRTQVPLHDLIREAGMMVDDTADVVLNPSLRMIELRHGNE